MANTYLRERTRGHSVFRTATHIRTASSHTSEKARGESGAFYIFIPLTPFFPHPRRLYHTPRSVARASQRTNERTISHPLPVTLLSVPASPPALASLPPLPGDGISHSKTFPRASRSPTRFVNPLLRDRPSTPHPRPPAHRATPERGASWPVSLEGI